MLAVFDDGGDSDDDDCQINLGCSLYYFPAKLGSTPGPGVQVCRVPLASLDVELPLCFVFLDRDIKENRLIIL